MNTTMANIKLMSIPAGRFFKMSYVSDVTLSSAGRKAGVSVLKRVVGTFRTGIAYKNTKKGAQFLLERGTPGQPEKLPWGEWKAGCGNRIICHTTRDGQYKEYARIYSTPNKVRVQHYLNGKPISVRDLALTGYVPRSYFENKEDRGVYTVSLNNIESIG